MKEIWVPVAGYEGLYEVSDHGRVRNFKTQKPLNPNIGMNGYCRVNLYKDKIGKMFLVQHIVATAFIGKRPDGFYCCHNDGVRTNNHIRNLRWDSPKSNSLDREAHGTVNRGERQGISKLTLDGVLEIKKRILSGETQRRIAEDFNVSYATICLIGKSKCWGWAHE